MKVLVTGAAGFIGGWTVGELRKRGFDVAGTDKVAADGVHRADLTDLAQVSAVFKETKPDAVIHLGAISGSTGKNEVEQSLRQPYLNFHVNALGTANVCEACRVGGVGKLIYMSSFAVYGKTGKDRLPITEETPIALEHAYATSKYMGELAVRAYSEDFKIRSAIFRAPFIVGEGQRERNVVKEFVESVLGDKELVIFGEGKHVREFIHPSDLADAYARALAGLDGFGSMNEVFVLGNSPVAIKDLAAQVIKQAGKGTIKHLHQSVDRTFDQYSDYSKAKRLLGWSPKLQIESIIEKFLTCT